MVSIDSKHRELSLLIISTLDFMCLLGIDHLSDMASLTRAFILNTIRHSPIAPFRSGIRHPRHRVRDPLGC